MLVNNEIGTIQPVKEAAAIAKKHGILFHTDAVQGLGNVPIDVKDMGVDMMSVSSHKIYGPKGSGALYIRKGVNIANYMHGGGQESSKRAGTENLAGIIGFGKAAELARINFESHVKHCAKLRDYLKDRILSEIPDTFVNGAMEGRHPRKSEHNVQVHRRRVHSAFAQSVRNKRIHRFGLFFSLTGAVSRPYSSWSPCRDDPWHGEIYCRRLYHERRHRLCSGSSQNDS